jgi:hypothetical protein
MKRKHLPIFGCVISAIIILTSCAPKDDIPVLSGEYLGQAPPGSKGELFAAGIMSTEMPELNAVFFPGGREVIYSVSVAPMRWALVMIREDNGRWGKPEVAPFSGLYGTSRNVPIWEVSDDVL